MAQQLQNNDTEEDIKKAFSVFDKEGTGRVEAATLYHYLVSIGETLSNEEATKLIKAADPKGTGFIEYQNFASMLMAV